MPLKSLAYPQMEPWELQLSFDIKMSVARGRIIKSVNFGWLVLKVVVWMKRKVTF
jgi:hypothetical protein